MIEQQERETMKVFQLINWAYIEEWVTRKYNRQVEVKNYSAFVTHMRSPYNHGVCSYIFDNELCGIESENVNLLTEDRELVSEECIQVPFYKVLGKNKIPIFPELNVHIPVSMIEKSLTGDIIDVREMMGDRRGYNDRLISNENEFFKYKL